MIHGLGVDLVEIARIERTLEKYGAHFESKYFTEGEIAFCRSRPDPAMHFAARFAVKEAVLKCLGLGLGQGVALRDIEVAHDEGGRPLCRLLGEGREVFERLGLSAIHVSISHEKKYAVAQAIAER